MSIRRPRLAEPGDVARGVMLLGVLHIHLLMAVLHVVGESAQGQVAFVQVKLLAPHVAVFFVLAGMTSRSLGAKSWSVVLQRSLMLVLLAWLSHVVGVVLQHVLWTPWPAPWPLFKTLVKPLVLGVGHSTFLTWFFIVLAVVRVLAFAFTRGWRTGVAALAVAAALAALGSSFGPSDNFYDWKRWPMALAMFLVGMRLSPRWRIPPALGWLCLLVLLALSWVNRPGLWSEGLCLDCELRFVAQPMVDEFGFLPLYLLIEALAVVFVLSVSQHIASSRAGRVLAEMGRQSLPLLVLHGWIILSFYGLTYYLWPRDAGPWVFAVAALVNWTLHLLLLRGLAVPLNRCTAACSVLAHRSTRLAREAWRGRRRMPLAPMMRR